MTKFRVGRAIALSLLISSSCAFAVGIPVFDGVLNIETARRTIQDLQEWRQKLTEYRHYLNQMKSLKNSISSQDWAGVLTIVESEMRYGTNSPLGALPFFSDPNSAQTINDLRAVLSSSGAAPMTSTDLQDRYLRLGTKALDAFGVHIDSIEKDYGVYANQQQQVMINEQALQQLQQRQDSALRILSSQGDESDLAALQTIAVQQQILMNQLQQGLVINNQQLQNYESLRQSSVRFRSQAVEEEAERLNNLNHGTPPLSGRKGWSDLGL